MLKLDDHRWNTLKYAYGDARVVPELLSVLATTTEPSNGHDSQPWQDLWSGLCHQGDTYDGAYAAVPHIVKIGCNATGPIDFSFFALPAAIEIARYNGSGPPVPADLVDAYQKGISRLAECVALHLNEKWDRNMLLSAMSAQAVAKGDVPLAEAIQNLDDQLIARLIALDFTGY